MANSKQTAKDLMAAAELAAESLSEYAHDLREDAADLIRKQTERIDAQIETLKEEASHLSEEAQTQRTLAIAELQRRRDALAAANKQVEEATRQDWEEAKRRARAQWELANEYLQKIRKDILN